VSVNAEANVSVSLSIDGTSVCTTSAAANGTWSCTITPLANAPHVLTATANDGTYQAVSVVNVTVDGTTRAPGTGRFSPPAIRFRNADRLADASAKPG
jgi:hypothetical protein